MSKIFNSSTAFVPVEGVVVVGGVNGVVGEGHVMRPRSTVLPSKTAPLLDRVDVTAATPTKYTRKIKTKNTPIPMATSARILAMVSF